MLDEDFDIKRLGLFVPSVLEDEVIIDELNPLFEGDATIGFSQSSQAPFAFRNLLYKASRYAATLRHPGYWNYQEAPEYWHRDVGGKSCKLLLWSSDNPTILKRDSDDSIIVPEPYEMIVFDNNKFEHRAPTDKPKRWFFRVILTPRG